MKLIVCLDNAGRMLFNGRRQSKDRALRQRVLQLACQSKLWMNGYSAKQFDEPAAIAVDESFLDKAQESDYCFVENTDISAYALQVCEVIVYRWNRDYPGDVRFPAELFADRWELISREEFPGASHDSITEEVYSL